jgi:hypothetical protein
VLTLRTQAAGLVDAVAFAQPAQASDDDLTTLASLRIPVESRSRDIDEGLARLQAAFGPATAPSVPAPRLLAC